MPAWLEVTVPEPLPVLLAVSLKPIWQSPCEHRPSAGQSEFLVHWSRPGDPPHARHKTVRTLAQTAIGSFMGLPPCETNLALKVGHSNTLRRPHGRKRPVQPIAATRASRLICFSSTVACRLLTRTGQLLMLGGCDSRRPWRRWCCCCAPASSGAPISA